MAEAMYEEHLDFIRNAPVHIRELYSDRVFPLVLLALLEHLRFPDRHLRDDLLNGFTLLGSMHEGVGWPIRADSKYTEPISMEVLLKVNRSYLDGLLSNQRHDQHWQQLLAELHKEHELKRVDGPYRLPGNLYRGPYHYEDALMYELPDNDALFAKGFSIEQATPQGGLKIRRGEDWRRSCHNATVQANRSPVHHSIDDYAAAALWWRDQGLGPICEQPLPSAQAA
eukprot:6474995-Amphidinium_carterae.1